MNELAPAERMAGFFNSFGPDQLDRVDELYAPDAVFEDPLNKGEGRAHIRAVFEDTCKQLKNISINVTDTLPAPDNRSAFIRWQMQYRFRGKSFDIPGVTHLHFDEHGAITSQRDFWDASLPVYGEFPPIGFFMKRIKKFIAVKPPASPSSSSS
ncbi:MAG: nuclear transport factor 2 family protein [Verrucomicrobiota bacterium]